MFDTLYALRYRSKDKLYDPHYRPHQAIRGKIFLNPASNKLVVIFPGWHTHKFPVNVLAKRLAKKGWAVLVYDFHDQIIEANEEVVAESFRYARDKITKELKKLLAERHYQSVQLVGISLGNVVMALVSDKFRDFSGATIVTGGDDLAIDMWYGLRTSNLREAFQRLHVGIRQLDKDWHEEAPIVHARRFANKQVRIYMSLNDRFVRTKYQERLAKEIINSGAEVKIKHSRLGHLLSVVRFCCFSRPV